jgi:hypothetical protein
MIAHGMPRHLLPLCLLLVTTACQLPSEQPPATPNQPAVEEVHVPAPLPPEETPPEEAPAPPPSEAKPVEPGITSTGTPTRGTLPKAVVDEKLKAVQPKMQACYERALKAAPTLRGNLSINFVVAPDGKVAHAEAIEVDDALNDAATVDCILAEIRQLQFPEPSGGRVFLNYPLKLEPPPPAPPAK